MSINIENTVRRVCSFHNTRQCKEAENAMQVDRSAMIAMGKNLKNAVITDYCSRYSSDVECPYMVKKLKRGFYG